MHQTITLSTGWDRKLAGQTDGQLPSGRTKLQAQHSRVTPWETASPEARPDPSAPGKCYGIELRPRNIRVMLGNRTLLFGTALRKQQSPRFSSAVPICGCQRVQGDSMDSNHSGVFLNTNLWFLFQPEAV